MKSLVSHLPHKLLQQANWLHDLNQQLLCVIPLELIGHLQVAGLHHGILILEADSPVWATKARYLTHEITKQLSTKTGATINSTKVVIRPPASTPPKSKLKKPHLSKYSARQLDSLAHSIHHPQLQQALAKLAKHYRD